METMLQDVKYALRQLVRQPSFSIVAGLTLALGIGLSTALFSVIDAALLRPLPYPNPEQLVTLNVEEPARTASRRGMRLRWRDIRIWRTLTTIVSHAGMGRVSGFVPLIVDTGTPQRLTVAEASEDFLETYGIVPILGRGIQVDDTRDGASGGRAARPRLLAAGVRRRSERARPRAPHPERARDHRRRAASRLLSGDRCLAGQAVPSVMLDRRGSGTPVIARLRPGVTLTQARRLSTP